MMINKTRELEETSIQQMLEQVGSAYPRLATIFRFRLDKINQDEKEAVVSPYWADHVRAGIITELQEVQREVSLP